MSSTSRSEEVKVISNKDEEKHGIFFKNSTNILIYMIN